MSEVPAATIAADTSEPGTRSRLVVAGLVVACVVVVILLPDAVAPWRRDLSTRVLAIVLQAVPYLLLGSLLAGLIELLVPGTLLPRLARRLGPLGVPAVALGSALLPTCECGVVSVTRGLLRKGLPAGHAIAYLLAAPILNPTVLLATWMAFKGTGAGPAMVGLRAGGALVVAIIAGLLATRLGADRVLRAGVVTAPACCDDDGHDHEQHEQHEQHDRGSDGHDGHDHAAHGHPPAAGPRWLRFPAALGSHVVGDFLEMTTYFLFGTLIAAAMLVFVGTGVLGWLGESTAGGIVSMQALAFVLSLCAEADAFVAVTFRNDFAGEALLAFLVFGPMCDIKLLLMYRTVFRAPFVCLLVGWLVLSTFAWCWLAKGWL